MNDRQRRRRTGVSNDKITVWKQRIVAAIATADSLPRAAAKIIFRRVSKTGASDRIIRNADQRLVRWRISCGGEGNAGIARRKYRRWRPIRNDFDLGVSRYTAGIIKGCRCYGERIVCVICNGVGATFSRPRPWADQCIIMLRLRARYVFELTRRPGTTSDRDRARHGG